jgi:adenine-specific DNA-methyltransferase
MDKDSFEHKIFEILKQNPDFLSTEGEVLKDKIIDSAYKADRKLIELLLDNPETNKKFFSEIKGHGVFNINDFVMFVQDKHFLNDSYTKYKNKIGLTIHGKFLNERKEVALVWPFKDTVLEGGMTKEDQKKKEIFFNEVLAQDEIDRLFAPKVITKWKRYTAKGEEEVKELKRDEDETIKENLIIKGNNLLALHSLKSEFAGKVKLIYIDPPYYFKDIKADDTFAYNSNFKLSTWLTFMKNRLDVARELLREDGVIFVQIKDDGMAHLKLLMDDIFVKNGGDFVNNIVVKMSEASGVKMAHSEKRFPNIKEYILFLQKKFFV